MPKFVPAILFGLLLAACRPAMPANLNVAPPPPEAPIRPTTTAEAIDTSDWKTYRNEEWGIEFRYPAGWVQEVGSTESVKFCLPPTPEAAYVVNCFAVVSVEREIQDSITLISQKKQEINDVWTREMNLQANLPEEIVTKNGKEIVILGPASTPSGMTNDIYLIVTVLGREELAIVDATVFGGDLWIISQQIKNLAGSITFL